MKTTVDGNTAAAHVAYAFSEVAAIYPITPASPMGELVDEWASKDLKNVFGEKLQVIEMQSEAGAAGAVHGSLSAGALTTTFTASQGLLLMLPNMFKIAGEMLPTVFHIAARSLAYQSLSIFGDHSDVMAARMTGFAMIAAKNVQEVADNAVVAHLSTLKSRVPFLAFFDGFRTSHEIQKVKLIDYETLKSMLDMKCVYDFRKRALSPDRPYAKVGAENPDVYFQGREASNRYYDAVPSIVKEYFDLLYKKTGRKYKLFEYTGAKDAKKVIVSMGSGAETVEETVKYLNMKGKKVGALTVRLYRPFFAKDFLKELPKSVRKIAVLDRTKEAGSEGEPLYLDIVAALKDNRKISVIGGRYGLSSKEFSPAMAKAVFDHLDKKAFHSFTVGINDDVTFRSIPVNEDFDIESSDVARCKFWGLGSDGTVGANKNSIMIIGEDTDMYAQGYFSYDSKKSGVVTLSYLRFGKKPIKAPYIFPHSDFIALHNASFIGKYDVLEGIKNSGVFLINSSYPPEEVFNHLTRSMQETIINKKIKVYAIDASRIAREVGLGGRISTVMQTAFFKLTGIIPEGEAVKLIRKYIRKAFGKKGEDVVRMNWKAVDRARVAVASVSIPSRITASAEEKKLLGAGSFAKEVIEPIMHFKGDTIPVSNMPLDGSVPTATSRLEKRGISPEVPRWIPEHCIQCGFCSFVCPHAAVRMKQIDPKELSSAPKTFVAIRSNTKNESDLRFKVQVYPEDCTGCNLCIDVCPTKEKSLVMSPIEDERWRGENRNADFFDKLPDNVLDGVDPSSVKGTQLKRPLFEFSGACSGCGETPYIKLLTQLFGERMIIANATGCSSIFGGTFPTIPYAKNKDGRGPAWANSLFEDNAEYAFGMRLAVDSNRTQLFSAVKELLRFGAGRKLSGLLDKWLKNSDDVSDAAIAFADDLKRELSFELKKSKGERKRLLMKVFEFEDYFVDKTVWAIGGDGWAYDIGFGGLDHVLAQKRNVNVLVLDTEVYSNTGGQASKSTPIAAVAKFAAAGKEIEKKNLGLMMIGYKYVYVASVDLSANRGQLVKAMVEAERYNGPSIIIAYANCISHGIDMSSGGQIGKKAVESGYWPLYRYNPSLAAQGEDPFVWDSPDPSVDFREFLLDEKRFTMLKNLFPDRAEQLYRLAEKAAKERLITLKGLKRKPDATTAS